MPLSLCCNLINELRMFCYFFAFDTHTITHTHPQPPSPHTLTHECTAFTCYILGRLVGGNMFLKRCAWSYEQSTWELQCCPQTQQQAQPLCAITPCCVLRSWCCLLPGGGFSVNFRCYTRLGNKFVTLCTDIFAWKMYPLYWNVQKILPQNAPMFMKCTENLAQNCTHLYAICGTNFIQRYTYVLKSTEC